MENKRDNHKHKNIYVQNFLRARHYNFSPLYSELIGRICSVESSTTLRDSAEGFCADLLTAFKGIEIYEKIDRVCLVLRVGFSNELAAVDTCNSARVGAENIMPPGYRCFVRSESSVFQLREGEIRIYDDASRVADAFERRDKPIQRSLGFIIQMGFKSGICIPLHAMGEVRGFLFLNSQDPALFGNLEDPDFAVLNVVAMAAKLALYPSLSSELTADGEFHSLKSRDDLDFASQEFDEEEFSDQLRLLTKHVTKQVWRPKIENEIEAGFLCSPATLAFITQKICSHLFSNATEYPRELKLTCADGETVQLRIPIGEKAQMAGLDAYRTRVSLLSAQLSFLRVSLSAGINDVVISFPFDPVYRGRDDVFYSV